MNSVTKMLACMICVVAGIAIQFFLGDNKYICVAGSLAILIIPLFLCDASDMKIPTMSGNAKKWKKVAPEDVSQFEALMKESKKSATFGNGFDQFLNHSCLNIIVLIVVAIVCVWIWWSNEGELDNRMIAVGWDAFFVPYAILRIKYGSPDDTLGYVAQNGLSPSFYDRKGAVLHSLFYELSRFRGCTPRYDAELSRLTNDTTAVTDVRIQVEFDEKIPNLLCAMFSVAVNKVQDKQFPYAYFVYVFKGSNTIDSRTLTDLLEDVTRMNREFGMDVNYDDGNTVLVVTKKRGSMPYYTSDRDCDELVEMFKRFYVQFSR